MKKPKNITQEQKSKLQIQITVEAINEKTKKTFAVLQKVDSITNALDFDRAGEHLKVLKDFVKVAKAEENSIGAPLRKALEKLREHFKPFYDRVTSIEDHIKVMMMEYIDANNKKLEELDNSVADGKLKDISKYVVEAANLKVESDSVSVRRVWKAIITDESKIPRKFLVPNVQAITEHYRQGGKPIPGVEWKQINSIAI